ncbi:Fc.00g073410.m01.CDS01 [Cosmosporella sp. VM-42]
MFTSVILLSALLGITIAQDSKPNGETLDGIAANCDAYHTVKKGDDCNTIASGFHISRSDFLKWNPAVSDDCTENFWVNYAYCVGVDETKTDTPSTTAKSTSPTSGTTTSSKASTATQASDTVKSSGITSAPGTLITSSRPPLNSSTEAGIYSTRHPVTSWNVTQPTGTESWPPKKTQAGQPKNCNDWHKVMSGETCQSIANTFGPPEMTVKKFLEWNSALRDDCSGLYNGWYVCIGVRTGGNWTAGDPSTPTIPTPVDYTKTTTSVDFGWTPSPTHSGQPENCSAWYQAKKGETCKKMTDPGFVSEENFFKWNPVLKNKCDAMEEGYWYCISAYGPGDTNTARPPTVTTQPSAVPSGQTEDCEQWYQADEDETCKDIGDQFGTFSVDDFIKWNPSVGPDCSKGTVEDLWYCVAVPGTPTTRAPYTPGPTTPPGTSTSSIKTKHSSNATITATGGSVISKTGTSTGWSYSWTSRRQESSVSKTTKHSATGIPSSTKVISHDSETITSVPEKATSTIGKKTTYVTEIITMTTEVPCPTTTEPGAPSCTCDENGISTAYVTQVVTITTVVPCETDIEDPTRTPGDDWPSYTDTPIENPTKSNEDWPSYTDTPTGTAPVTTHWTGYTDAPSWTTISGTPTSAPGHSCSPRPVNKPWPSQPNIDKNCRRFYLVHHGDDCERLAEGAGIRISDFLKWNPSVNPKTCSLKPLSWYCIGDTNPVITLWRQFPKPTGSCN